MKLDANRTEALRSSTNEPANRRELPKEREAMMTLKRIALISMAIIAATATTAPAGTKYAANIVSNYPTDPPPNPTLSVKSSVKLDDKGNLAIALAGVTDGAGLLVTTSTSYHDTLAVDGTEYVAILKLYIPGIAFFFPVVEVPVPVDLKAGKGKTKLSAASLFGLIPAGVGRTVEVTGVEVWGPLGAGNAGNCQAELDQGFSLTGNDPACRGGTQIGMSGIAIPAP
jgi:hypothetical protein